MTLYKAFSMHDTSITILLLQYTYIHSLLFCLILKVSNSWKQIIISLILPKNERNSLRILSWACFVPFLEDPGNSWFAFEICWPLIVALFKTTMCTLKSIVPRGHKNSKRALKIAENWTYRSQTTGSDGVSFRLPQLFFSQHRLKKNKKK